ncbi:MAG TPA: hypothetical protein VFZ53_34710, partial [Polyangiaceae bacterium]
DLAALLVGGAGRIARVEHAWLRARPRHAPRARALAFGGERNPPLDASELEAFEAVVEALSHDRSSG